MSPRRYHCRHCLSVGAMLVIAGCSGVEKAPPQPTPADVTIELDVPPIMQGTVASETRILGYPQAGNWAYNNVVVRGYGLVVGLNGTGSREVPPQLRAHMRAEMTRRGIGAEREGMAHLNAEEMLNSLDTSVVVVEAVIPPGATEGELFNVRVLADPRTGTTSLEGGRLYTTELRPGPLRAGAGPSAFALAEASGPIFINPFAEPGSETTDVNRTVGHILNGGSVLKDMPIKLQLVNPSHVRAQRIQNEINTTFPRERGQDDPTARGESDELIAITIPPTFRGRTDEFIALLQHTTLRRTNPQAVAMSIRRSLVANPGYSVAAALRWEALGQPAVGIIRELYDHPDELPRLAALTAGARLGDGLVIPHLIEMTRSGSTITRRQAIELLGRMPINLRVDTALRKLVNDPDVDVRLTAYEALSERGDPSIERLLVDGKFLLEIVESDYPMVFVTQQDGPKIVVFGRELAIDRPLTMSAWSNRFMLKGDSQRTVDVYYRPVGQMTGESTTVDATLARFISFLGHTTGVDAPQPGLAFSYSETVGALHQIWSQGFIKADFKADQDRVLAAITRRESQTDVVDRPEFAEEESGWFTPEQASPDAEPVGGSSSVSAGSP